MKFRMVHNNFNVLDLGKSLKFYRDAFDMHEVRRIERRTGASSSSIRRTGTALTNWN